MQAELARRRETLEAGLREMRAERAARWEGRVGSLRAATVQSEEWMAERVRERAGPRGGGAGARMTDETKTDEHLGAASSLADTAFAEEDDVSRQLLRAIAKDAALEDAMDALDEGLDKGVLKLPDWLRATRKLSKEQFMARAKPWSCGRPRRNTASREASPSGARSRPRRRGARERNAARAGERVTSKTYAN